MMRGDRPVCIPWAGSRRARLGICAACRRVGRVGILCCRFRFRGSRRGRWGGVSVAWGGVFFGLFAGGVEGWCGVGRRGGGLLGELGAGEVSCCGTVLWGQAWWFFGEVCMLC